MSIYRNTECIAWMCDCSSLSVSLYAGAMLAICDVNEYRKCVKVFNIPMVSQLFDTLHALCNLLFVVPDNLKVVCTGEQLVGLCGCVWG